MSVLTWLSTIAVSDADLITFDEVPLGTPVDGMVIGNVTFGGSSLDAIISLGPGSITFVQDPSIEGDAFGTLTLDFATPVLDVSYGYALSTRLTIDPGTTMELFDGGGGSLGVYTTAAGNHGFGAVEGLNSGAPPTPIHSAVIVFDSTNSTRFAFDNLEFTPIPEPSIALLLLCGLGMTGRLYKRHSNRL